MKGRLLLLEGRSAADSALQPALERAGLTIYRARTGKQALQLVEQYRPQIIVFDTTYMRTSGSRTCRLLRSKLPDVPLIHCRAADIARDDELDAHIYLQQPFTPRKLLNRIRALLPAEDSADQIVRCGDITLFTGKRSVMVEGRGEHLLTPKMVGLLEAFLRNPNVTLSRRQLMNWVWKTDYIGDTRTLDVHVRWLREIVEEDPAKPQLVRTVRGRGYIFVYKNKTG